MRISTPGATEAVGSDATFDLKLWWMLRPVWQRPKTHYVAPLAVAFLVCCLKLTTNVSINAITATFYIRWK